MRFSSFFILAALLLDRSVPATAQASGVDPASRAGLPHSAIGRASTPTLDPGAPAYGWTDHGVLVQSQKSNNFNAIDPSVFSDDDGTLWLAFGSFAGGMRLAQLSLSISTTAVAA